LESAVKNSLKFVINSTIGLGGVAKPAEQFGINGKGGDFGQTLHVWGVPEGPFIVIPAFGPSTGRDAVGILGDLSLDPVGPLMSEQARVFSFGIRAADVLGKRGNYSTSLDSILYGSADSYEQMKLIYLQARRFELDGTQEDDYFDPYEEIFNEN
jgi:phospholipid-binding lipoprotein MlaA